jgi:hypothetical protein
MQDRNLKVFSEAIYFPVSSKRYYLAISIELDRVSGFRQFISYEEDTHYDNEENNEFDIADITTTINLIESEEAILPFSELIHLNYLRDLSSQNMHQAYSSKSLF